MYGEVEKVIFLANEITNEKEMEMAARKQHDQLVKKEEELRLASLDLQMKLEESGLKRKEEMGRFQREIMQLTHVLDELPHAVITINNLGFVLFVNRRAEELWKVKREEVTGTRAGKMFPGQDGDSAAGSFADPAMSKKTGIHAAQKILLPGGSSIERDILIIRTDLEEEVHYTLVIL
jgi:PAS domain-containing protein